MSVSVLMLLSVTVDWMCMYVSVCPDTAMPLSLSVTIDWICMHVCVCADAVVSDSRLDVSVLRLLSVTVDWMCLC